MLSDKNDIKIFILYLLENIRYPLDFVTINDIVMQNEFVGYFDFAECFAELLDAGHIVETNVNGVSHYSISPMGSHVASQLQSNLLAPIRERSLKSALRLLSFQKRGAKLKCETEACAEGQYRLRCMIVEGDRPTLDLSVMLNSWPQLETMKKNFEERPEVIYRGIMALLAGEVDYLLS